jgi:hypothetical protein
MKYRLIFYWLIALSILVWLCWLVASELYNQPDRKQQSWEVPYEPIELTESDFTIEVSGDEGLEFSGSYCEWGKTNVVRLNMVSGSVRCVFDGTVPARYSARGFTISYTFQKKGKFGVLKVRILKEGKIVAESSTSSAYGVVSATTR